MNRIKLLFLCLPLLLISCGTKESEKKESELKNSTVHVKLQLNWFPEAEHGGYFHGAESGLYEKNGIKVNILNGGPGVPVETEVGVGRVEFGIANADKILAVRENGLKVIGLLAPYQKSPRCILVHKDSLIKGFKDLAHVEALIVNNTKPFYKFLNYKYPALKSVKTIPYSQATFLSNSKSAMQGYSNSEPLVFKEKGVDVKVLNVAEIGFNPYASVLICSEKLLKNKPDLVKKMVELSRQSWLEYLKEPSVGNRAIVKQNPKIASHIKESSHLLKPLMETSGSEFGRMTPQRWRELESSLYEIGVLKSKQSEECFKNL